MAKHIYLIRHGETYFNSIGKIQGWCDSPLSEKGIAQAKRARQMIIDKGIEFDAAYSSTQGRAMDTLEIISGGKINYKRRKDLREMGFGRFEGEARAIMPKVYGDFFVQFGGESVDQVTDRMNRVMREIAQTDSENILVVSHGRTIKFFTQYWQEHSETPEIENVPNCSILKYHFDNEQFKLLKHIIH